MTQLKSLAAMMGFQIMARGPVKLIAKIALLDCMHFEKLYLKLKAY